MKKLLKYLISWSVPAVILFLVIMGNVSLAKGQADAGPKVCPPHQPDGGCDGGVEETPDIPPLDAGTPDKGPTIKIPWHGKDLKFIPTDGKDVQEWGKADAGVPKWLTDRRATAMAACAYIQEEMAEKRKHEVRLHNFLFSDPYTEGSDAALCIFEEGSHDSENKTHKETAIFLIFTTPKGAVKGGWHTFPADFVELDVGKNL